MNDRFKFRGWYELEGKLLPVEVIDFRNQIISLNEGDNSLSGTFEMIELSEYTGVNDIQNEEIFEGDIVEVMGDIQREFDVYECRIFFDKTTRKFKANEIRDDGIRYIHDFIATLCDLRVIGNIYQEK